MIEKKRFIAGVPAALILGALFALPASGQVQYRPSPANLLPSQTQTAAQPTAAAVASMTPNYAAAPAYGYPGYAPRQGPVGGYLNGTANVINARGQYDIQYQQAQLMQQDVEREKMKTQQMMRDQMRYEESIKPDSNDIMIQNRERDLRRARNDPPSNEIWSGGALNDLLQAIIGTQSRQGVRGPHVSLDSQLIQHIHVTGQPSGATPSVFRAGGKIKWPLVLQDPRFEMERAPIDEIMPKALSEAKADDIQFATFTSLRDAIGVLGRKVDSMAKDLSLPDLINGQRHVQELTDAMNLLKQPNASKYFNGEWEAKGNSVAELVDHMSKNGLKFAPAGVNDQTSYSALYQALVSYDSGLSRVARR